MCAEMNVEDLSKYGYPDKYIDYLRQRGIHKLNPIQVEAIHRGLFTGCNMLVVAPTASGKTLIAELALVKHALSGGMGVYLTPLKALANEKFSEFKSLGAHMGLGVDITTGDFDKPAEFLGESDVVVATYERFDSLLRLKPSWLNRLSIIVIDELHNINDPDRGPVIEMIVARAKKLGIRLIGLSASIGNPEELASWLNGTLVFSNWRPVKLVEGVFDKEGESIVFIDGRREPVETTTEDPALDLALHNVRGGFQTLVFLHNRKRVEELAVQLSKELTSNRSRDLDALLDELEEAPTSVERDLLSEIMTRGVAFHHAGLSHIARRVVEEAFRRRLLKVVYATPTLAAGVNLPARRVLISIKRYDPERGRKVGVSIAEYKQMSGRAGRPSFDDMGESIIIDAENPGEAYLYINSNPEPVTGRLFDDERNLRIHVLSLIASGDTSTREELVSLLENLFSSRRSKFKVSHSVDSVLKLLEDLRMLIVEGSKVRITRLGKITSYSYLDPSTVSLFINLKPENYSDLYVLHLTTLTPDFARSTPYLSSKVLRAFEDLAEAYHQSRLIPPQATPQYDYDDWLRGFVAALALSDWISEKHEDEIYSRYGLGPGDLYNMKDTASWIVGSLSKIFGVLGDTIYFRELAKLSQRLDKGVKADVLELASLRYIGRVRARVLVEHGIKTVEDLAKTPRRKLLSLPYFGLKVVEEIYKQLEEMGFKPPD